MSRAWGVLLAVVALLGLAAGGVAAAGAPAIDWQRLYGGSGDDRGNCIYSVSGGDYILAGTTASNTTGVVGVNHGGTDIWVARLDSRGGILWQRTLGGAGDEEGSAIRPAPDGGFILAGITASNTTGDVWVNHGGDDGWVVKLSADGEIEWQRVLGGIQDDALYGVIPTTDGGYILTGDIRSDFGDCDAWVMKLSGAGAIQWQGRYGGTGSESGRDIRPTPDGGYVLGGATRSNTSGDVGVNHGDTDAWVVKLSSAGAIGWQKVLGGSDLDFGCGIDLAGDGGYLLTGYTFSNTSGDVGVNHGAPDAWVVKLDGGGAMQWQRVLGGSGMDFGFGGYSLDDGGHFLTGPTTSNLSGDVGVNHGSQDMWAVRLDPVGDILWQRVLGSKGGEFGGSISRTDDGAPMLAGTTSRSNHGDVGQGYGFYDMWVVRFCGDIPVIPLPGFTSPPTDPDGDCIHEDLNANGRLDFSDVVLFFSRMQWIAQNEPVAAFDLNGNGRIDFADIVALFNEV